MNKNKSTNTFDVNSFNIQKYDSILARGLSKGLGTRGSQICIEAAICETLGLKHGDDPKCVAFSVRSFKITLNDSSGWSSTKSRAKGLRDLGIAQLGSLGIVSSNEFATILARKTIQVLIPKLFREIFPNNEDCLKAALRCEKEGTAAAAHYAAHAAHAADAADAADAAHYAAAAAAAAAAAHYAAHAADAADAAHYAAAAAAAAHYAAAAAAAAHYAAAAAAAPAADSYLTLSASLALETLRELKSPGVQLLG
jgi:hypothetical protein